MLAELKRDFVRKSAMEEEIKKAEEKLAVIQNNSHLMYPRRK